MRPKPKGKGFDYEFRAVTEADLERERIVEEYVGRHLAEWQEKGWVPDMCIEPGDKTDEPIRTRGWTHWHHLFNPRQLLVAGLAGRNSLLRRWPARLRMTARLEQSAIALGQQLMAVAVAGQTDVLQPGPEHILQLWVPRIALCGKFPHAGVQIVSAAP